MNSMTEFKNKVSLEYLHHHASKFARKFSKYSLLKFNKKLNSEMKYHIYLSFRFICSFLDESMRIYKIVLYKACGP